MARGRQLFEKYKNSCDAIIFFDEINRHYLSGFYSTDGLLAVTESETKLILDSRYYEAAVNLKKAGKLQEDVVVYLLDKNAEKLVGEYAEGENIIFDSAIVTIDRLNNLKELYPNKSFIPKSDICGYLRRIKSNDEIKFIKTAQEITDAAFEHITDFIRKGVTEQRIAAEIEFFMRLNGADGIAFETIVVSGQNSSLPHGVPSETEIAKDSFITMDFGAKFNGYCSDMTRTVVFGKATDKMKNLYSIVLDAQQAALDFAKPGAACSDVDKAARDVISKAGYGEYFGHSTGHSLGLEIHESPRFSSNSTDIAQAGNIMTVEPGIYLPGEFGVRIEDMIYITETGTENLTKSPKQLLEL
ncbi:aminopeptidase P family protein [Eubacteriales bacterium OttesenSCG-928-G02]|nr:aminopeptidase P family protein [Eubacteriales bacterium OttesenSCG-928-G02]